MIALERYRIRDRVATKRSNGQAPAAFFGDPAGDALLKCALDDELTILQQALQDFEVLERVQQGGQGVVYKARQRGTQRSVALKLLLDGPLATEQQRARFAREIELVSRLRHPNIVTVYESGVARGRNFYAMEFVEGLPINDYAVLHDLPPAEIVRLIIKICGAIQHAHQNGIIHRDLNPANILIDEAGEPRVFDFGLAKDLWAGPEDGGTLCTAAGCGTLPYLSPEQAGAGDGRVDVRSDVYAIGLVLYELLTDMLPYPVRGEPGDVRTAIINAEPLPLRQAIALGSLDRAPGLTTINRDLEAILAKTLAKAKAERYQSAAELGEDLQRWLAGDAVRACIGNRWYVLRKTFRRHRIAVGIAATVLAALSVTAVTIGMAWSRVRVERDGARAAARTAYDLFDMALTDIEESVRPLAGGVAVRDRLIGRLTDKLPELERLAKADPKLEAVALQLQEKQGAIALQQGRRGEAAGYLRRFLEASLARCAGESSAAASCATVLRAYRELAQASDDPSPLFTRALEFGTQALARHTTNERLRYEWCRLLLAHAAVLRNSGRYEEALSQFERALASCAPHDESSPSSDFTWSRAVAEALAGRGMVMQDLGDATGARQNLEESLQIRARLVAEHPADTQARFELLLAYGHLADLHRDAAEPDEAKRFYGLAAEQGELLAAMDRSCLAWHRDRFSIHERWASMCLTNKEVGEAQRAAAHAIAVAEDWAAREASPDARAALFDAHALEGKVRRSERDWDAAAQSYNEALVIAETLLQADPNGPSSLVRVAATQDALGFCARELGDLGAAVEHCQRALEIYERIRRAQPDVVIDTLRLVQIRINCAYAYRDMHTRAAHERADDLLAEARCTFEELESAHKLTGLEAKRQYMVRALAAAERALAKQTTAGEE